MPNNNQNSPYLPDFSGPLSGDIQQSLQPPSPIQVPNPTAKVSRLAAAAALTDKFLSGLQQGRVRKYAVEQAADAQKRTAIAAKLSQIQNNPNLSDEAKDQAYGIAVKALAGAAQQGMDGDGKGKKGKTDQNGNPLVGFAQKALTGLTGGPLPKGAKIDLGGTLAALSFYEDGSGTVKPQYSVATKRNQLDTQVQKVLAGGSGPPGTAGEPKTREDAIRKLAQFDPQGRQLYGDKVWEQKREQFLEPFKPSAKDYDQDIKAKIDAAEKAGVKLTEEQKQEIVLGTVGVKPQAYNLQTRWAKDPSGKSIQVLIDPRKPGIITDAATGQPMPPGTELVEPPSKDKANRVMRASELAPDGKYHDYIIDSTGKTVKDLGPSREGEHFVRAYDAETGTYYGVALPTHAAGNGKESKMGAPPGAEAPAPETPPQPKKTAAPKESASGPPKQHVEGNRFAPKAPEPTAPSAAAHKPKGVPLGDKPPTGADTQTAHKAQAILSSGSRVAQELDTLEQRFPEYTGQFNGRKANIQNHLNALPPEMRDLKGQVESVISFLPSIHGLRGKYPMDAWKETLGDPFINPKGTAGAIRGALKAVKEYNDILTGKNPSADGEADSDPYNLLHRLAK